MHGLTGNYIPLGNRIDRDKSLFPPKLLKFLSFNEFTQSLIDQPTLTSLQLFCQSIKVFLNLLPQSHGCNAHGLPRYLQLQCNT